MFEIDGKPVADPSRPYVIAEMSGNHCGSLDVTRRLLDAIALTGAAAVKLQTYTAAEVAADTPIPEGHDPWLDARRAYPGAGLTLREHLAGGGFPRAWHAQTARHAASVGLTFLSTPFSVDAAKFLVEEIGVPALKIASGDLTFTPLVEYAAQTGLPLLVSCGGATLEEVLTRVHMLAHAWDRLILLWCRAIYPCPPPLANVRAIHTLRTTFPQLAAVGWSDHTTDVQLVPMLALSQGATVFEKHVGFPDAITSADVAHSIPPGHLGRMVARLQDAASILGDGEVGPHARELHDRLWARRGADGLRPTDEARAGRWQ